MSCKLLIDECLSPALVGLAVAAGHVESSCVRDLGWSGTKDWKLVQLAVVHDYTLVTHNSVDFRGGGPGRLGGPPRAATDPRGACLPELGPRHGSGSAEGSVRGCAG